eukprot:1900394-Amphidinium_carterae.1
MQRKKFISVAGSHRSTGSSRALARSGSFVETDKLTQTATEFVNLLSKDPRDIPNPLTLFQP